MRSRSNLFSYVNLTCLKCYQVEKVDFCVLLPRTNGSTKTHFSIFVHIQLGETFRDVFKTTFWTMVPFLFKLSFFRTDFSHLEILLEHMGPKILSPVPVNWHKTPKISGHRRTDGHQNLDGSHTKALRAITHCLTLGTSQKRAIWQKNEKLFRFS